ncbi:MAG: decarboxylating NADP(+)-dependent phosphogluconate dehydrogenase, partial [Kiritimatiellae bacterium]|nr:decarboxylating NADP(+)-dependent phosphogluconate dehydrogenase [Kiritimatiellia bacterium]
MSGRADIGVVGLAVMGENLILNIESRGYAVACYNRTTERVKHFLKGRASGRKIQGCFSLEELTDSLERPRKILLMVRAGAAVDGLIDQLLPLLTPGDILIDGGNSFHRDTTRRMKALEKAGVLYVGMGVSGGEEGALKGPSLMPGGRVEAWPMLKDILQSVAAKTDAGEPCCDWMGPEGAGHFVKMVHNGIEYGDMQLIAEAYDLMRTGFSLTNETMSRTFLDWNRGVLNSYLIEITADILAYRDEQDEPVLDHILDAAGQKGTGRWTVTEALEL